MSRPTKFDLMRAGRERAESLAMPPISTEAISRDDFAWQAEAPAVPTMEIDGVKYREEHGVFCDGCAFETEKQVVGRFCEGVIKPSLLAFGGGCNSRRVIYIRAE